MVNINGVWTVSYRREMTDVLYPYKHSILWQDVYNQSPGSIDTIPRQRCSQRVDAKGFYLFLYALSLRTLSILPHPDWCTVRSWNKHMGFLYI